MILFFIELVEYKIIVLVVDFEYYRFDKFEDIVS